MKQFKIILSAIMLMAATGITSAQTKIAHINYSEVIKEHPKFKEAQATLQQAQERYQKRLQHLENEIRKIEKNIRDSIDLLPQIEIEILQQIYQEKLEDYQLRSQEYQANIEAMYSKLLEPIHKEVKEVVKQVAREKGYDYVLDSSEGSSVIFSNDSFDLMEAVRKKLAEKAAAESLKQPDTGGNTGGGN